MTKELTIKDLRENGMILFEGIVGSQAYGIATPTSDVDTKGVFIQPLDSILGFGYQEQVSDTKNDHTFYEIRRFLELMKTNNPNILELLSLPEECILIKDPLFDLILDRKNEFITKLCDKSFGGYAVEQIKKARGLNKKIVKKIIERKGVLDFCFVPHKQGSIPVLEYLSMPIETDNSMTNIRKRWKAKHGEISEGFDQKNYGLVAIPYMRFTYGAYYMPGKAKGIVSDPDKSNDVSLTSIEDKNAEPWFVMIFNKDAYSTHCREYRETQEWDKNKNPHRFADNMAHGKGYDGKNLAHCHRLLDMAIEIGEGKGIIVKRQNREQLLSIRAGLYEYDDLIKEAEMKIRKVDEVFANCALPEKVDSEMVNELLLEIRKKHYFNTRGISLARELGIEFSQDR